MGKRGRSDETGNDAKRARVSAAEPCASKNVLLTAGDDDGTSGVLGRPGGSELAEASLPRGATAAFVAAGRTVTLALTDTGVVYSTGRATSSGRYGDVPDAMDQRDAIFKHFGAVKFGARGAALRAAAVAAGTDFGAALCDNGSVHAFGTFHTNPSNIMRTAFSPAVPEALLPVKVHAPADRGDEGVALAAGKDHLLILTRNGSVLASGCGACGQLGRVPPPEGATEGAWEAFFMDGLNLKPVPGVSGCVAIAATAEGSFFRLDDGSWLVSGRNGHGQMGLVPTCAEELTLHTPTPAPLLARFDCIAGGYEHALGITPTGELHSWGRADAEALGRKGLPRRGRRRGGRPRGAKHGRRAARGRGSRQRRRRVGGGRARTRPRARLPRIARVRDPLRRPPRPRARRAGGRGCDPRGRRRGGQRGGGGGRRDVRVGGERGRLPRRARRPRGHADQRGGAVPGRARRARGARRGGRVGGGEAGRRRRRRRRRRRVMRRRGQGQGRRTIGAILGTAERGEPTQRQGTRVKFSHQIPR